MRNTLIRHRCNDLKRTVPKLLFLLFPLLLSAQPASGDSIYFKAKLTVSGFWQSGNVQTSIFRSRTDLTVPITQNWMYENTNSYVYQAFGRTKADEDFYSLNFLYFNARGKIAPLLLGFMSTNYRRAINARYLLGGGVRFQLVKNAANDLKFALTSEYESTEFNQTDFNEKAYEGERFIQTLRGTLWIKGKYLLAQKKLILRHESYFQPSMLRRDNFRWWAEVAMEVPVWKGLHFTFSYIDTYESIVIQGQAQEDRFFTLGFVFKYE